MADQAAGSELSWKLYFFVMHVLLFFLGAYLVLQKIKESNERNLKCNETLKLSSSSEHSDDKDTNKRDEEKKLDEKLTDFHSEHENTRPDAIPSDISHIDALLDWIFCSYPNYSQAILNSWLNHIEKELNKSLAALTKFAIHSHCMQLELKKSYSKFPVTLSHIIDHSNDGNKFTLGMTLNMDTINFIVTYKAKAACCYIDGISLTCRLYLEVINGRTVVILQIRGEKENDHLHISTETVSSEELLQCFKDVLRKNVLIKINEEEPRTTPTTKTSTVSDNAVADSKSSPSLRTASSTGNALVQPVSPLQLTSSTALKKVLINNTSKKPCEVLQQIDEQHPSESEVNLKPAKISVGLPVNSDVASYISEQGHNNLYGDTDSAYEQDSEDGLPLTPLGDFESIQDSLERTFHKLSKSEPVPRKKYGSFFDYESLSDVDSAIDPSSPNSDTKSLDTLDGVVLRNEIGFHRRSHPHRHSFHHGPRMNSMYPNTSNSRTFSQASMSSVLGSMHSKHSSLIIEVEDKGTVRYYHIPPSMAKKEAYIQRGKKIHVYNDHLFEAVHFTGSPPTCVVCYLPLKGLGKQGYTCRDCKAIAHKQCHCNMKITCPSSTLGSLNIVYVGGTDV